MQGTNTPFVFGKTVSMFSFTNREEEFAKLKSNLLGRINTMLVSPRRWGKSSLVEKVAHAIDSETTRVVIIDLFTIGSEEEFLEVFAREVLKKSSTRWEDWVGHAKNYFKQLMPKVSVGVDPTTDFSIGFDWKELKKYSDEVLNLPEVIAKEKGIQFVICIDEFQNLSNYNTFESFEKKMRAVWQRQKQVTYCLYGSNRHMMEEIFNHSSKPFYRFGDFMYLPKIKREKWISFILESFKNTEKTITEEQAAFITDKMNCHSWYVQQFSHYVWVKTSDEVTEMILQDAMRELIDVNTPFFQAQVESLSNTQLNLLKAVASGEKQITSVRAMQDFKLGTSNNIIKNREILIKKDILQFSQGDFEWLDPVFLLWFLRFLK